MKRFWKWLIRFAQARLGVKPIDFSMILDETGGPQKPPRGAYTSFSGVDVKVFLEDDNENFACIPEIQAISCKEDDLGVEGTIISLLFDQDVLAHLPFTPKNLLLEAANEYGHICYVKFYDIKFTEKYWGISMDDIIAEATTVFRASSCTQWTSSSGKQTTEFMSQPLILERLRSRK
jgi:hypothetical protein